MYTSQHNDISEQEEFLNCLEPKIGDLENEILTKPLDLDDIYEALNSTQNHKSPGIDGLPYEFYKTFWESIKYDVSQILNNILSTLSLTESQSLAIIVLHPKSGNAHLLSDWRPISLMTCDYKLLTKVFANRLKCLVPEVISREQYCCPGKTIVDCNLVMRDVLCYCNEHSIQGAVLTLDWSKAYDRLDHCFLYAALRKIGFSEHFVKIVKLFCSNAKSAVQINGNITETFNIGRGIRQGCPLSMILYVLFKEALYCYIKSHNSIKGLEMPNNNTLKILGFADDTNLFLRDNNSIREAMNAIAKFEKATGAILNKEKTKIYGIGAWDNKIDWPLPWLQSQVTSFKSLGIIFSNNFELAVKLNWESVLSAIEIKTRIMQSTQQTIYQRAVILNCVIYSKLWYIAHLFPMPVLYANKIKRVSFNYIWGRKNYEPIKRSTLTMSKCEGGLGILDILYKSQSILVTSFIKLFLNESSITFMVEYYNFMRLGQLFNRYNSPNTVSYTGNVYYQQIVKIIQKCIHVRGFPELNAKKIYDTIMPNGKPMIETYHPNYQWKEIWNNLTSKVILPKEREILFKFHHEVLPTKKRLKQMKKFNVLSVIIVGKRSQILILYMIVQ